MTTYLKKATAVDLPMIVAIYTAAKQLLARQQIPQWQNNSGPTADLVRQDIHSGRCYLLMIQKQIVGVASLTIGVEAAYEQITAGHWESISDTPYAVIHRVALHPNYIGKGLALNFLEQLIAVCQQQMNHDIRIDTHPKNLPMQKVIKKAGFHYRGILFLSIPDGERFGYQFRSN